MAATMTPSFGLQQPEDSMEISSEYGMDADIDIDLDGAPDNMAFVQDDHHMIEDPKSDRLDDDMVDDAVSPQDNDRVMQDDAPPPPQEHDEELLDFSDAEDDDIQIDLQDGPSQPESEPELQPQPQPQPQPQSPPTITVDEPIEQVQSEVAAELLADRVEPVDNASPQRDQDTSAQPQPDTIESAFQEPFPSPTPAVTSLPTNGAANNSQEQLLRPELAVSLATESDTQLQPTQGPSQESHREVITETTEATQTGHDEQNYTRSGDPPALDQQGNDEYPDPSAHEHKPTSQPVLTRLDTEASAYDGDDADDDVSRERHGNSPTVTGLHPTVVEYDGNEVYLFPSRDPVVSEQYLLDNENLVTTSLGDLLQACRTALGDGVSEDEELVLGVEELDLYVSEDSTPAFSTSFQELLDMYLQLHKLDGNDTPPPFRVSLSTKTRFTNRLTLITQAISEGKGFSQLSFLQYYQYDEPTELPDEDFEDDLDESAGVDPDHVSDHAEQQAREASEPREAAAEGAESEIHGQSVQEHEAAHDDQPDLQNPVESHKGEYEGDANVPAEALDRSEVNQDETQYFDAQGEVQGQDEPRSHHEGEPEAAQGDAADADDDDDDSYLDYEHTEAHHSEHESASPDHVTSKSHAQGLEEQPEDRPKPGDEAGADEEQEYGLGQFFDENNYEYTENDGDVNQSQGEGYAAEEYGEDESLEQHETAHPRAVGDEHEQNHETRAIEEVDLANLHDEATAVSDAQGQTGKVSHEDGADVEAPTAESAVTDEEAGTYVENGEEEHTAPDTTSADDGFDEINFDDEDGYEDELQQSGLAPEAANGSRKTSPAGKRSFSERDEVDDDGVEQDNKKARAH